MARINMKSGWEREVARHVRPAMEKLGNEMLNEWKPTIHVDSGEMKAKAYVKVNQNSEIKIGSPANHAVYEELGTSERPGHPTLGPVVRKYRGRRNV